MLQKAHRELPAPLCSWGGASTGKCLIWFWPLWGKHQEYQSLPIVPRGLVIYPAWKYKSISHRSLTSNQTVIFSHYQPGPDADWWPEGKRLWTQFLIPWATDSHGSLFVITLVLIRKLRGISTTNRKSVGISNSIFNYRKSLARFQALFAP